MTSKHDFDNELISPKTFANPGRIDALYKDLRENDPVHWTEPDEYRPFWAVTKHADIMEIEKQNDIFVNHDRTTLMTKQQEADVKEFTGGSHLLLRTLVHMDNPDHRAFRGMTQSWFMPPNLKKLEGDLANLAKEFVDKMEAMGGECDFVNDVAVWYPLRVIMTILGVPREDEAFMLKLTQEIFGASDDEMKRQDTDAAINTNTITDFFNYFTAITEDRRKNPKDDVASVIANAEIDGKPIDHLEAMSYYIIVATAGHDTTSSSTAGGLMALMDHPGEMQKLRNNMDLMPGAIDETIRWVTPVKHFLRTAKQDYELRGKKIEKEQSLLMCYPSGNRDEDVFQDPFTFNIERKPNRHLAFGFGAHLCLGMHLAKMEMRALYNELLPRLEHIELAGEPSWVQANFVSGLKHMPVRYRMKKKAA